MYIVYLIRTWMNDYLENCDDSFDIYGIFDTIEKAEETIYKVHQNDLKLNGQESSYGEVWNISNEIEKSMDISRDGIPCNSYNWTIVADRHECYLVSMIITQLEMNKVIHNDTISRIRS